VRAAGREVHTAQAATRPWPGIGPTARALSRVDLLDVVVIGAGRAGLVWQALRMRPDRLLGG
jgi:hypothetical protein